MTSDGKIVPYRMSVLMEIAAKVAKTMVTGAVSLSYEEMENSCWTISTLTLRTASAGMKQEKRRTEMFLKISEFKKAMKSTLKTSGGLVIGNVKGHFLVHASLWGVWVESIYATSKFKAAIVELIGDMPEEETCYRYRLDEKTLKMEYQVSYEDPYDKWKEAKDFACEIPLVFYSSPHELAVYQINSDRSAVLCSRDDVTGRA